MKHDKCVFPTREVDATRDGWIADMSGPKAVNPDAYFHFRTRACAHKFVARVDAGEDAQQVYAEMIERSIAAATLGSITSDRKARSSAANGKLGGRPKKMI